MDLSRDITLAYLVDTSDWNSVQGDLLVTHQYISINKRRAAKPFD